MNITSLLHRVKGIFILSLVAIVATSCSKSKSDPKPVEQKFNTQFLINSKIVWTASAGSYFYKGQNATGDSVPATGQDLGTYGIFPMSGVTFMSADSAFISDYGYPHLKWGISGATNNNLEVVLVPPDQPIEAQIISLNSSELVIVSNNTKVFQGYASYKEVLIAKSNSK
jgi:hypothetical protein